MICSLVQFAVWHTVCAIEPTEQLQCGAEAASEMQQKIGRLKHSWSHDDAGAGWSHVDAGAAEQWAGAQNGGLHCKTSGELGRFLLVLEVDKVLNYKFKTIFKTNSKLVCCWEKV